VTALKPAEAARRAACSVDEIRRAIRSGELAATTIGVGVKRPTYRIIDSDLTADEAWLRDMYEARQLSVVEIAEDLGFDVRAQDVNDALKRFNIARRDKVTAQAMRWAKHPEVTETFRRTRAGLSGGYERRRHS
jgi:hypothetical protein